MEELLAFGIIVALLAVSPGPNLALVMTTALDKGSASAMACVAGIAAAIYIHGALSIFGLTALILLAPALFTGIKIMGAVYLIWLGLRSLSRLREPSLASIGRTSKRRSFADGFLTNTLNPKIAAFYLAAFPSFMTLEEFSGVMAFRLVVVHSVVLFAWFGFIVMLMRSYSRHFATGVASRYLKALGAIVMMVFGIGLITYKPQESY